MTTETTVRTRRGRPATGSGIRTANTDPRRLQALFESIVVNAKDAVLVTEADPLDAASGGPRVVYVNAAFTQMTGYEPADIIGLTPRALQSPKTDRGQLALIRSALLAQSDVEVELLNVAKNGAEFWSQISITPVTDDAGQVVYFVAIQRDVTVRKEREYALQSMLDNSSDLMVIADQDGFVRMVNSTVGSVLGSSPEDLIGSPFTDLVHAEDRARGHALVCPSPGYRLGANAATELRLRHRDGAWRWMEISAAELGEHSGAGVVLACRDVTASKQATQELKLLSDRLESTFHHAPIGMAITDPSGRFLAVNAALAVLLGRSQAELLTLTVQAITPTEDVDGDEAQRQALLHARISRLQHQTRVLHADGNAIDVLHSASVVPGGEDHPPHLVNHFQDISERKRFEAQLRHQALHDPLTGLANRALLMDRLDRALLAGRRTGATLAVLFLDVDRFKTINDSLGHRAGDLVLVALARRLEEALLPSDTVARFAGDEFVVLRDDSTPEEAAATAIRLAALLQNPVTVLGTDVQVTTSIGVAVSRSGLHTGQELLREADAAMYSAKDLGRARVEVFDKSLSKRIENRLQFERELRTGIAAGELRLHYQPVVSLIDRAVVGKEALVRWQHPEHGLLAPSAFIGLAEESGLIHDLGAWVLGEAMRDAVRRRAGSDAPLPVVWVNLSPQNLEQPEFPEWLDAQLREHGLPGSALGLEITESVLMRDVDAARQTLLALGRLGVRLAIDDFGTGYSSLSYLARFPVDTIKIDRAFISGLDQDDARRESFAIVGAVIGLSHALQLAVVAEGVETASQSQALHGLGCDFGQGFFFGRPGP